MQDIKNILGVTLGHIASFAHVVNRKIVAVMEAERYFRQNRCKLHCQTTESGKRISGYQHVLLEEYIQKEYS